MSVHAELDLLTAFLGRLNHPAREGDAVEIAHIHMSNPWCDFSTVLAEWRDGRIHYQVVDNYPHLWSYRCTPESSDRPLSLGELIQLIDTAELVGDSDGGVDSRGLVFDVLDRNAEESGCREDLKELRSFIRVTSPFYDELEVWYAIACDEWYATRLADLEDGESYDDDDVDDEEEVMP